MLERHFDSTRVSFIHTQSQLMYRSWNTRFWFHVDMMGVLLELKCSLVSVGNKPVAEEGNTATFCRGELFQPRGCFLLVFSLFNAWIHWQTADYSGVICCYINKPLCSCLLDLLTPFLLSLCSFGWLSLRVLLTPRRASHLEAVCQMWIDLSN